jgi:hypothetical protein
MEQATKGQIGQPAACMIENKWNLRAGEKQRNYHRYPGFSGDSPGLARPAMAGPVASAVTHKICG